MIIFQKAQDSLGSQKIIKTKNMILEECGNFFKMNMMINSKQPLYSITIVKFLINKDRKCYSKYLLKTWIVLKILEIIKMRI